MRSPNAGKLYLLVHVAALLPLAQLIWDGWHNQLTANPIQAITLRTGKVALVLLVLSLACTPVHRASGSRGVLPLRRTLGLYAFLYASLHGLTFVLLDYQLDLALLREALFEKRFALAGLAAFTALLPLAITSTQGWQRRLGRNWKRLHRLTYLAALLAVLHFLWQVKADATQPLLFGALVVLLLLARLPGLHTVLKALRPADSL